MRPLCVIGRGRLGLALQQVDPDCVLLSARDAGFAKGAASAAALGANVLITARDPDGSPEGTLSLAGDIAADLMAAGVPPTRLFHAGSYTVGNPRDGTYQQEKRGLEDRVRSGHLPGHVLRLPIVCLGDAKQRAMLAQLARAIAEGEIDARLRLAVVAPDDLRTRLGQLPSDLGLVEIVGAALIPIAALITDWQIEPAETRTDPEALTPFTAYSRRLWAGELVCTHYEEQATLARV